MLTSVISVIKYKFSVSIKQLKKIIKWKLPRIICGSVHKMINEKVIIVTTEEAGKTEWKLNQTGNSNDWSILSEIVTYTLTAVPLTENFQE